MESQLRYFKSWKMMLWKWCTQYASKFGKLSSVHRTGKGQFSFHSQRRAMPKNDQTTAQLYSSHTLAMAPHSSTLAWKIPWTEKPGRLQSIKSQTRLSDFTFFGIGMKTDLFQSCDHCGVFPICCHIECSTFTASSFRIWNSSTGILSPPLTLFIVMLPKAHLTFHSRMSGSRWVIIPLWLSGSLRSFLYSFFVYSCHLFLIIPSVRFILFLSFSVPIFAWNVPLVYLIFLKRFFTFFCFPLFLWINHWGKLSYLSLLFFGTLH